MNWSTLSEPEKKEVAKALAEVATALAAFAFTRSLIERGCHVDVAVTDGVRAAKMLREDASEEQIKDAYRRNAKEHHPDSGGAAERFREVQQAYETLSDPEARTEYDSTGRFGNNMAFEKAVMLVTELVVQAARFRPLYENGYNPLNEATNKLTEAIRLCVASESEAKRNAERLRTVAKNIEAKEGENFLAEALENSAKGFDLQAIAKANELAMLREAIKVINGFNFNGGSPDGFRFTEPTKIFQSWG